MSIENICKQFGITSLVMFGSAVRGVKQAGDVDLCYTRPLSLSITDHLNCIDLLQQYFSKENIDLVYWSNIASSLKKEIADNHKILYSEGDTALNHINIGEQMFWDEKKYYDEMFREMKTNLP
ncbi:MAG: nucleotidyltransferase domain-containing protein [Chitinophagales bacterium]|nr:nucleotidyltransferase domain-containing protein [Chitinophagales bacterium]